jgi:hypothetical protein
MSIKPGATKSAKKYYETFYVGEEGTQYFIKPLTFNKDDSNEKLLLDITFRYKKVVKDSSKLNFSIKSSQQLMKSIDSLKISNDHHDILSNDIDLLFNEKNNDEFLSRFTTQVPLENTHQLFDNNDWEFTIYFNKDKFNFKPTNKTQKAIKALSNDVFSIMNK